MNETLLLLKPYLTPIVLLLLGVWARKIAINHEKRNSLHNRIIEKRVNIYDAVGKNLNDIFSFVVLVGDWKKLTPEEILSKKREVDQIMYINRPYWSKAVFNIYISFMNTAFEVYTGSSQDAQIRANSEKFKKLPGWNDTWKKYFSTQEVKNKDLWDAFDKLTKALSKEFGFYQKK